MVYYIYGENTFASRKKLNQVLNRLHSKLKAKTIRVSSKGFDSSSFSAKIRSKNLFDEKRIFVIDGWQKFSRKQKDKILKSLKNTQENIVFWTSKNRKATKKLQKNFDKVEQFNFPQPKVIFKFLDAVYPKNQKQFFKLFNKLLEDQPIELVFYFLKKHCRNLITVNNPGVRLAGWQKRKLNSQKRHWNNEKLKDFYNSLLELEYKNKTGKLPSDIDLPLVNLLTTL